jgi:hypothetical protein
LFHAGDVLILPELAMQAAVRSPTTGPARRHSRAPPLTSILGSSCRRPSRTSTKPTISMRSYGMALRVSRTRPFSSSGTGGLIAVRYCRELEGGPAVARAKEWRARQAPTQAAAAEEVGRAGIHTLSKNVWKALTEQPSAYVSGQTSRGGGGEEGAVPRADRSTAGCTADSNAAAVERRLV